jgi:hypothetical protein
LGNIGKVFSYSLGEESIASRTAFWLEKLESHDVRQVWAIRGCGKKISHFTHNVMSQLGRNQAPMHKSMDSKLLILKAGSKVWRLSRSNLGVRQSSCTDAGTCENLAKFGSEVQGVTWGNHCLIR